MNILELIGIIFIIAIVFNVVIAFFALKSAEHVKNVDLFEKEI